MKRNRYFSRRQFLQSTAGAAGVSLAAATVLLESTPLLATAKARRGQ